MARGSGGRAGQATRLILIYVHALVATGVVRNVRLIAEALSDAGHDVAIVTALPGGEGVAGVPHHALLPGVMGSRLREKTAAACALRRYIRRSGATLMISAGNHGHGTVRAASIGLRRPARIYRISNDLERRTSGAPGGWLARWGRHVMARLIADDAARLVLASPTLADTRAFRAVDRGGRVVTIANGIDAANARSRGAGPVPHPWMGQSVPVVLAIGRLAPQKNFMTLLDAFARLRAHRPARLILLGESRDDARRRLLDRAAILGVADHVALPGVVDNVFPWLAGADAFILPSWWEGSANVLLEAMAVDTPCVASRSAGNAAQLLDDGRHGLLVDPDDAGSMADGLMRQLDPATRLRPGNRIDAFSLNGVRAGWVNLINLMVTRS